MFGESVIVVIQKDKVMSRWVECRNEEEKKVKSKSRGEWWGGIYRHLGKGTNSPKIHTRHRKLWDCSSQVIQNSKAYGPYHLNPFTLLFDFPPFQIIFWPLFMFDHPWLPFICFWLASLRIFFDSWLDNKDRMMSVVPVIEKALLYSLLSAALLVSDYIEEHHFKISNHVDSTLTNLSGIYHSFFTLFHFC